MGYEKEDAQMSGSVLIEFKRMNRFLAPYMSRDEIFLTNVVKDGTAELRALAYASSDKYESARVLDVAFTTTGERIDTLVAIVGVPVKNNQSS